MPGSTQERTLHSTASFAKQRNSAFASRARAELMRCARFAPAASTAAAAPFLSRAHVDKVVPAKNPKPPEPARRSSNRTRDVTAPRQSLIFRYRRLPQSTSPGLLGSMRRREGNTVLGGFFVVRW